MAEEKQFVPYDQSHRLRKLYLVFTIVNNGQANSIIELLNKCECALTVVMHGKGTAPTETYSLFAGDPKKNVLVSVLREDRWPSYQAALEARFGISAMAKGIAFAIPMDTVFGVSIYKMLSNNRSIEKKSPTKLVDKISEVKKHGKR